MKPAKIFFYPNFILFLGILLIRSVFPLQAETNPDIIKNSAAADDFLSEETAEFNISVTYKNLFVHMKSDNFYGNNLFNPGEKRLITDLNRIRISPDFKYSDILIIHADYDNELIFSNYNKTYEFDNYWRDEQYNEFMDLIWEPRYGENAYYRTKIHRAYIKLSIGNTTLSMGRQQIRFGSGRLWNPLDILNPLSPTFVEGPEEQKGTDAVKLDYFYNMNTEISFIYNQKRLNNDFHDLTFKESNFISRIKTSINETDIAVLGGIISKRKTLGMDASAVFLDGILRGSILYSNPEKDSSYLIANGGYEYTFAGGLYLLAEYFYNENGLNFNDRLKTEYEQSFITGITGENYNVLSNRIITYNRHYLGLALGYDFHPLLRGDFFTIYDVQGRGLFLNASLKYNFLENADFTISVLTGFVSDYAGKVSDFKEFEKNQMFTVSVSFYF